VDATSEREPQIHKLFRMARKFEAAGLELRAGSPPAMWLRGVLRTVDMRPLSAENLDRLVGPILWPDQQQRLDQGEEVAFTYAFEAGHRFQVSDARMDGGLRVSARWIGVP
jgi:twitching motility protein PilT